MAEKPRKSRQLMSRGQFQTLVAAIALIALVLVDTLFTNAGISEQTSFASAADFSTSSRLFRDIEPTEITFRGSKEVERPLFCELVGDQMISISLGGAEPCLTPTVD